MLCKANSVLIIVVLSLLAMLLAPNRYNGVAAQGSEGDGDSNVTTTTAPDPAAACRDTCEHGQCVENPATGNVTCVCEGGWTGDTCSEDINECQSGESKCGKRQFCVNTQGGFVCVCRPGYDGKECQRDVSHVYGGQLAFESLEDRGQGWSSSLQEIHTTDFKSLALRVENAISQVLAKKSVPHIGVNVVKFTKVSGGKSTTIVAKFQVTSSKEMDIQLIKDAVDTGWKRCNEEGVCDFGADGDVVYGALKNETALEDNYDLCDDDRNNVCNDVTTECVTVNGTASCQCRPGFETWSLYDNSCKDINECEQSRKVRELCGHNAAACVNTVGSYRCECPKTHAWNDQRSSCVWSNICKRDDPCQNEGSCYNIIDKDGEPSFVCRCTYWWTGRVCGSPDPEAERMLRILIGVATGLGVLCILLLIIIIIILCCRRKRANRGKRKSSVGIHNFGSNLPTPDTRCNGILKGNVTSAATNTATTTSISPALPSPTPKTTSPDSDSNASSDYVVVDDSASTITNGVFTSTAEKPKPAGGIYTPTVGGAEKSAEKRLPKLADLSPEDNQRGKGGNSYGSYNLGYTPRRSVKKVGYLGGDGKEISGQLTSNQFISDRL